MQTYTVCSSSIFLVIIVVLYPSRSLFSVSSVLKVWSLTIVVIRNGLGFKRLETAMSCVLLKDSYHGSFILLLLFSRWDKLPVAGTIITLFIILFERWMDAKYLSMFISLNLFSGNAESQEFIDAELAARVLQLINVTDSGLHCQVKESSLNNL